MSEDIETGNYKGINYEVEHNGKMYDVTLIKPFHKPITLQFSNQYPFGKEHIHNTIDRLSE